MSDLDARVREYLTRFPHRDTDMSKYGVCRDWLISVIQAEAERCAEIVTQQIRRSAACGCETGCAELGRNQILRTYKLDGKTASNAEKKE